MRRKVRRNGRDGWTVPGVDERCGVVVMYRTAPGSAAFDDLSDELEPGTCSETRLAGWRRDAAGRRAGALARRGVRLVLCTEEADDETLASFAENGIEIAEGVPERDASHVCRVLRVLPTTSSLPNALETCDVGVVDGFSAQRIGGDAFAYLRTDRAFAGIIHGVDFVQARAARNLVARALAAVATASVPSVHPVAELAGEEGRRDGGADGGCRGGCRGVRGDGSLTLVPGAGAADSCVVAAVRERLDELRAGNRGTRDGDGDEKSAPRTGTKRRHPGTGTGVFSLQPTRRRRRRRGRCCSRRRARVPRCWRRRRAIDARDGTAMRTAAAAAATTPPRRSSSERGRRWTTDDDRTTRRRVPALAAIVPGLGR